MKLLGLRIFGDYEPERGARAARNPLSILADVSSRPQPLPRAFHKQPVSYERRIWLLAFLTGFPGALVSLIILWTGSYTPKVQWTLTVFILSFWLGCAFALRERVVMPLQTLSALLAALREGDYSIRGRMVNDDALGDVVREVNTLSSILRAQRLGALEATALLRTVTNEIDVAILAFDSNQRLRLINRAGERLLDRPSEQLLGRDASDLGIADCLEGEAARTMKRSFPGGVGRWGMRRSVFREGGKPHQLVVIADLSQALREEERIAWQRLVRVLGHELNNSLTPIKSIAGSLEMLLSREPRPIDWEEDVTRGLSIVNARAESLNRFMNAYAKLAKLPQPNLQPMDVGSWVRQVVGLETRMKIELTPGPSLTINGDRDQLEQLLINLIRNAVDAANETDGGVLVSWRVNGNNLELLIEDEGAGLSNTSNLFVPFFTTKPGGSGIGLALSRQIAEGHGGMLMLENRAAARGCEARLRLPV